MPVVEYETNGFEVRVFLHESEEGDELSVEVNSSSRTFGKRTQQKAYNLLKNIVSAGIGEEKTNLFFKILEKKGRKLTYLTTRETISNPKTGHHPADSNYFCNDCLGKKMTVDIQNYKLPVDMNKIRKKYVNESK